MHLMDEKLGMMWTQLSVFSPSLQLILILFESLWLSLAFLKQLNHTTPWVAIKSISSTPPLEILIQSVWELIYWPSTPNGLYAQASLNTGWRDGSTVKNTGCAFRGPEFNPQEPHGGSQPYGIIMPQYPLQFNTLFCQADIYANRAIKCINKEIFFKKNKGKVQISLTLWEDWDSAMMLEPGF